MIPQLTQAISELHNKVLYKSTLCYVTLSAVKLLPFEWESWSISVVKKRIFKYLSKIRT